MAGGAVLISQSYNAYINIPLFLQKYKIRTGRVRGAGALSGGVENVTLVEE
jgi:hypothetical protein